MKDATPAEFEVIDDVTVRHKPTGTQISTYRYENPDDIGDLTIRVANDDDSYNEDSIRNAALDILKAEAHARKAAKDGE